MELIDFSKNKNSILKQMHIESVLLYGDPDACPDAEITVCIPTYKRAEFLSESLRSVLYQNTNISYRIIVVDNDPDFTKTDTLDIIKSFRQNNITYYKNKENLLLFGNINRCIVLARTKWVSLLHDDDLLLENYISEISKVLTKYEKKIKGLSVNYKIQGSDPWVLFKKKNKIYLFCRRIYRSAKFVTGSFSKIPLLANLFDNPYGSPSCGMVFDRNCFIESGGFNQDYFPAADRVFYIIFSLKYNFHKFKKSLSIYRFEVNTYLQPDVMSKYPASRKLNMLSILSLKRHGVNGFIDNIIFRLLNKDIRKIIEAERYEDVRKSFVYYIFALAYKFFL
jgi:glycosyltransferase involved in cell wall biosynthesis